jgi:hypothetical protein
VSVRDYAAASMRVARRTWPRPGLGREERLVFVVGCPRSGTTFLGAALGSQPGFVDLDEVTPWKAALPSSPGPAELRRILERVRLLGLASGLRGVEQTPETAFVLPAALAAYPQAVAVHSLRDGRDVVCSLLERGWFAAARDGADDAGLAYGPHARFWVDPERREEFASASEARRCAWAWRRYVSAAREASNTVLQDRVLEVRYESVADEAERLAAFLGSDPGPLHRALDGFRDTSIGRWRRDLTAEQLAEVEAEAGALLADLEYA